MQREAFAFMPTWMGSSWLARGPAGWWTTRPSQLIIGHVVYMPYDKIFKMYIWKALGLWNWEADVVRLQGLGFHTPDIAAVGIEGHIDIVSG